MTKPAPSPGSPSEKVAEARRRLRPLFTYTSDEHVVFTLRRLDMMGKFFAGYFPSDIVAAAQLMDQSRAGMATDFTGAVKSLRDMPPEERDKMRQFLQMHTMAVVVDPPLADGWGDDDTLGVEELGIDTMLGIYDAKPYTKINSVNGENIIDTNIVGYEAPSATPFRLSEAATATFPAAPKAVPRPVVAPQPVVPQTTELVDSAGHRVEYLGQ